MKTRRSFIKNSSLFLSASLLHGKNVFSHESKSFGLADSLPAIPITKGPGYHWFGYYDKWQFDQTGRYVLGMKVDFEHRSPSPEDVVQIGIIDLKNNYTWKTVGTSSAWGWQQGCMLQWVPGSSEEIIWNDRKNQTYVAHILNIKTWKKRTLPKAIYALSPDGSWAIGTEFSRIQNLRPGYGYAGLPDKYENEKAPATHVA